MRAPEYNAEARRDLRKIFRSSYVLFGTRQAERYSDLIEETVLDLASGLRKGYPVGGAYPDHWCVRVGAHHIFYRLAPDDRVVVIRILHSRMDVRRHL